MIDKTVIEISIRKYCKKLYQPKRPQIYKWIIAALMQQYQHISINVLIVTNEMSKQLNRQLRKKNNPTNVIAIEYPQNIVSSKCLFGELILCDQIIVDEATKYNKQIINHYAHLIIHGMLHLQGFDHIRKNERLKMEKLETDLLHNLQISNPYIFEE
jgi:probable rRNA maturation factor